MLQYPLSRWERALKAPPCLANHCLRNTLQFFRHLLFGTGRRWPYDHPRRPSVVEVLTERTVRGLAIYRDGQGSRITPGLPGQGVERAPAGLDLSRSNAV